MLPMFLSHQFFFIFETESSALDDIMVKMWINFISESQSSPYKPDV